MVDIGRTVTAQAVPSSPIEHPRSRTRAISATPRKKRLIPRILATRADVRRSAEFFAGLIIVVFLVCVITVDVQGVGQSGPLILPKFGLIAIPDSLALFVLLLAVRLPTFLRNLGAIRELRILLWTCGALVIWGAARGLTVDLLHTQGIGPEARGLFFTCAIALLSTAAVIYQPKRAITMVVLLTIFTLVRNVTEWSLLGLVKDVDQGMLTATLAAILLSYATGLPRRAWGYFLLSAVLIASLLTSTRRTPFIILGVALATITISTVISKRQRLTTKLAVLMALFAIIGISSYVDSNLLGGNLSQTLQSLNIEESRVAGTSNWEHLNDAAEAYDLALRSPILGYGTGTLLLNRTLSYAGEDVPIHSPYLHSWVHFGGPGLLAYFWLQIFVALRLWRSSVSKLQSTNWDPLRRAILVGLFSYLFGQWAMPPFYIDYKQSMVVGLCLGLVFGIEYAQVARRPVRRRVENVQPASV